MPSPRSRSPQARLSCTCTGTRQHCGPRTLAPGFPPTPPPACAPPRAQVNLRQLHSLLNFAAQDAVVATSYFPNWFQIPYPCVARTRPSGEPGSARLAAETPVRSTDVPAWPCTHAGAVPPSPGPLHVSQAFGVQGTWSGPWWGRRGLEWGELRSQTPSPDTCAL